MLSTFCGRDLCADNSEHPFHSKHLCTSTSGSFFCTDAWFKHWIQQLKRREPSQRQAIFFTRPFLTCSLVLWWLVWDSFMALEGRRFINVCGCDSSYDQAFFFFSLLFLSLSEQCCTKPPTELRKEYEPLPFLPFRPICVRTHLRQSAERLMNKSPS